MKTPKAKVQVGKKFYSANSAVVKRAELRKRERVVWNSGNGPKVGSFSK